MSEKRKTRKRQHPSESSTSDSSSSSSTSSSSSSSTSTEISGHEINHYERGDQSVSFDPTCLLGTTYRKRAKKSAEEIWKANNKDFLEKLEKLSDNHDEKIVPCPRFNNSICRRGERHLPISNTTKKEIREHVHICSKCYATTGVINWHKAKVCNKIPQKLY